MTTEEIEAAIREVLEAESTMVLATADEGGEVSAASLFYCWQEGPVLFWLSSEDSRHSRNLTRGTRVAVTVHAAVWDWTAIRGLQMEGSAGLADTETRAPIVEKYKARFGLGAELAPVIEKSSLYVFRPEWVRLLDGFRHHEHRPCSTSPRIPTDDSTP